MERRKRDPDKQKPEPIPTPEANDTPLWHKYYMRARKRVRFPRYYKRAMNW